MPSLQQFKDPNFLADNVSDSQPAVVLFVPHERSGEVIDKLFAEMEGLSSRFAEKVKFFWLETELGSEVCQKFGIDRLPEVVLFHEGKVELVITDPSSEGCLVYNLEKVLVHEGQDFLGLRLVKNSSKLFAKHYQQWHPNGCSFFTCSRLVLTVCVFLIIIYLR